MMMNENKIEIVALNAKQQYGQTDRCLGCIFKNGNSCNIPSDTPSCNRRYRADDKNIIWKIKL